jgi:hypothetical protein
MYSLMRPIVTLIVFLSVVLLAGAGLSTAQEPKQVGELIIDVDNAAVWHGDTWDNQYTDPGAVLFHDGKFHMLRNGFIGWPAPVQIAYTVSEDGRTWEKMGEDPVLRTEDIPYAGLAALASSLLVEDDGTWVLYFYTWPQNRLSQQGTIGRATAPAPEGPWTPDPEPVLLPGEAGDWDEGQLVSPSVVKTPEGYMMFYHGGINPPSMIGMATSSDGRAWEKYDNPETTAAPFANSDPVFLPNRDSETAWDRAHVNQPRVVVTDEALVMLYRSWTGAQQNQSLGFARSTDGITWERLNETPIFSDKDIARRRLWFTGLAFDGENYYVYLELQRGYQGQTDIYAGVYVGDALQ